MMRTSERSCWDDAFAASMSADNDEGLWRHPLYSCGLDRLLWLGVVQETDWVRERFPGPPPLEHFIATMKECVVEVLAADVVVERSDLPPVMAAAIVRRPGTCET